MQCLFAFFVFLAAPEEAADGAPRIQVGDVVVAAQGAHLMLGKEVRRVLQSGAKIQVTLLRDDWLGGYVTIDGQSLGGWVHVSEVRPATANSQSEPGPGRPQAERPPAISAPPAPKPPSSSHNQGQVITESSTPIPGSKAKPAPPPVRSPATSQAARAQTDVGAFIGELAAVLAQGKDPAEDPDELARVLRGEDCFLVIDADGQALWAIDLAGNEGSQQTCIESAFVDREMTWWLVVEEVDPGAQAVMIWARASSVPADAVAVPEVRIRFDVAPSVLMAQPVKPGDVVRVRGKFRRPERRAPHDGIACLSGLGPNRGKRMVVCPIRDARILAVNPEAVSEPAIRK